jgi:hemerythrin
LIDVDSYARAHFAREEQVMEVAGFAGLAEHRASHAALLEGWIFDHVMSEDVQMRESVAALARRIVAARATR